MKFRPDTEAKLKADLEKSRAVGNKVFEKRSPKEFWKATGCIIQACKGFENGRIIPCKRKHNHVFVFYYMSPYYRISNFIRLIRGKKPKIQRYHFGPDWEYAREYMYITSMKGLHQPEVAVWFMEAILHPTYALFLKRAMEYVTKFNDAKVIR